jgi:hypothetical protein
MRWVKLLIGLLPCAVACGGTVAKDKATAGTAGATATPMGEPKTVEVIDDVDHAGSDYDYPPLPPGSSGFFWRGGLGNWFATSAEGRSQDAPIEETVTSTGETGKAYHVSGDGQSLGVELWAQLNHPTGLAVDLSAYSGISFKAREVGVSGAFIVAFGANGQFFQGATSSPETTFDTSDVWQTFTVRFEEVGHLDPSAISSIDFILASGDAPFDLWVDELALICSGKCP